MVLMEVKGIEDVSWSSGGDVNDDFTPKLRDKLVIIRIMEVRVWETAAYT